MVSCKFFLKPIHWYDPLVNSQFANLKMAIEFVDSPIKNGDFPFCYVSHGKSKAPPPRPGLGASRCHAACGTCSESRALAGSDARAKLRGVKMWLFGSSEWVFQLNMVDMDLVIPRWTLLKSIPKRDLIWLHVIIIPFYTVMTHIISSWGVPNRHPRGWSMLIQRDFNSHFPGFFFWGGMWRNIFLWYNMM